MTNTDTPPPPQYAPLRADLTAADVKIGRGRPGRHDVVDRKTGERIGTLVRLHAQRGAR